MCLARGLARGVWLGALCKCLGMYTSVLSGDRHRCLARGQIDGHRQSWLFSTDFWLILGCFGLFKTKSWLSPADVSSHRHSLSVSADRGVLPGVICKCMVRGKIPVSVQETAKVSGQWTDTGVWSGERYRCLAGDRYRWLAKGQIQVPG